MGEGAATVSDFRYLYHGNCSAITPTHKPAPAGLSPHQYEVTHTCCCSLWRIGHGGRFMVYRRGGWREPGRGEVKSKVTDFALAPLGAVEALTRPTRAKPTAP